MRITLGDYVVYPAQGVGRVTAVEERDVAGHHLAFAQIRVLDTEADVLVPVNRLGDVGVRPVMGADEADGVMDVFDEPCADHSDISWIRRRRDYEQRVGSGATDSIAGVLRDLYVMKWAGPLSFGQLRLFETSRRLVIYELSIALDGRPEEVEEAIMERIRAAHGLQVGADSASRGP